MAQNSTPSLQTHPHQVTCAPSISTSHSPHTTTCSTASYLNNFLLPPQWPLTHSFHSITPMSPACNAHLPLPATRPGRSRLHISSRSRVTLATQEQTLHLLPASCSCHGSLPQHTVGHSGAQSALFEGSEEYWPRGQETKATDRGTETVCLWGLRQVTSPLGLSIPSGNAQ